MWPRRLLLCLVLTGCSSLKPPEPVRDLPQVTQLLQQVLPGATIPAGYDTVRGQEFVGMISVTWSSEQPDHNLHFDLQSSRANPSDDGYRFSYAGKKISEDSEPFFYLGKTNQVPRFVICNNGTNTLYYDITLSGQQQRIVHLMVSGPDQKPDRPALESFLKTLR